MTGPDIPTPVMPVVSVLSGPDGGVMAVRQALEGFFGGIALESEPFPFDMSDYYVPEMGGSLFRVWFCFSDLRDPSELPDWKVYCRGLEQEHLSPSGRTVNLDPGYLDHGKLVLASFKPSPDKIYMGNGVWAHTCLRYRFGDFSGPDHSFPDFIDGRFNRFFKKAKGFYRRLLRTRMGNGASE